MLTLSVKAQTPKQTHHHITTKKALVLNIILSKQHINFILLNPEKAIHDYSNVLTKKTLVETAFY